MSDTVEHEHDHYLSPEDWVTVVDDAQRILDERIAAETEKGGAGDYAPMGLTPRIARFDNVPDKSSTLLARQLYIIHTGETPLRVGFAESLTRWGSGGYDPRASWHFFVDPATVAFWISIHEAAWSAAGANPLGFGFEQAGYASFTRAQWLAPDGLRQMDLLAQTIVTHAKLPKSGLRWLTDAQVSAILTRRDKTTVGLCTHEQVSRLSGRTSRTDPGKGYPKDVLLEFCQHYHPDTPATPAPVIPAPTAAIGQLTEDGSFGPRTVTALQLHLIHTYKVGTIKADGSWGLGSRAALERCLNYEASRRGWSQPRVLGTLAPGVTNTHSSRLRWLIGVVPVEGGWTKATTLNLQRYLNKKNGH